MQMSAELDASYCYSLLASLSLRTIFMFLLVKATAVSVFVLKHPRVSSLYELKSSEQQHQLGWVLSSTAAHFHAPINDQKSI